LKKIYVLDTSVLVQSPNAVLGFQDNLIVLPGCVLEELDNLKKAVDYEIRANTRWVARFLDQLRSQGELNLGVALPNGGELRVEMNCIDKTTDLPCSWPDDKRDNRILAVAKNLQKTNQMVIIVTKDVFLRIKADVIGVPAEDYRNEQVEFDIDEQYRGWEEQDVPEELIDRIYRENQVMWNGTPNPINKYFLLKAEGSAQKTALARYRDGRMVLLNDTRPEFYGFKLNLLQKYARDALRDDSIPMVT
jgi:PhoH-like ATPase